MTQISQFIVSRILWQLATSHVMDIRADPQSTLNFTIRTCRMGPLELVTPQSPGPTLEETTPVRRCHGTIAVGSMIWTWLMIRTGPLTTERRTGLWHRQILPLKLVVQILRQVRHCWSILGDLEETGTQHRQLRVRNDLGPHPPTTLRELFASRTHKRLSDIRRPPDTP